jgi:hypothetical protein
VAKNSIAVAILRPDEVEPDTEKIAHDEASIRRLIARFDHPRELVACEEAGSTDYELHRLLYRGAHRRRRPVAHPEDTGRPGEDRPPRLAAPRTSASCW